jgi:hypothetical protein
VNVQLAGSQLGRYHRLADVVLDGSSGAPAASEADSDGRLLARALRARPDLLGLVERLVQTDGDPDLVVAHLFHEDHPAFEDFYHLVVSTYFMNRKILKGLGYPGQKANVPFPDEAEVFLEDGILEPVIRRGPIYRQVEPS